MMESAYIDDEEDYDDGDYVSISGGNPVSVVDADTGVIINGQAFNTGVKVQTGGNVVIVQPGAQVHIDNSRTININIDNSTHENRVTNTNVGIGDTAVDRLANVVDKTISEIGKLFKL